MSDHEVTHPDPDRLAAYAQGRMDPEAMDELEGHLSSCEACCQAIQGQPDDALIALLRSREAMNTGPPPEPAEAAPETIELPIPSSFVTRAADKTPDEPAPVSADAPTQARSDVAPAEVAGLPADLIDHPRYRVVAPLGSGGMGAVYRAEHRLMERPVALKVLRHDLMGRPELVERFRREVRAAARLAHPNIVTAHDAEQAGSTHFLVMEFVDGMDLARVVRGRGPLPAAEACGAIGQAATGLQHAHERGMVHRDVKPQNLMLAPDGRVKILDFGLARFASEVGPPGAATESGLVLGTADYIAPEQADDPRAADIRADIYGLGCTLYFLLTGQPPFPGGSLMQKLKAHSQHAPRPLADLRPDLPPGLDRVLGRMMAKDPALRYQTPGEVARALSPFAEAAATVTAVAPDRPSAMRKPARPDIDMSARDRLRRPPGVPMMAAMALVLAGVALLGLAVFRVSTDKGELIIEAEDPDVAVVVKQGGRLVTIVDPKTDQTVELRSGAYQATLAGKSEGLTLSTDTFSLKRGERTIVTVRRVPPGSAAGAAAGGSPPFSRAFSTAGPARPLTPEGVAEDQGAWRIEATDDRTVRLFEVPDPGIGAGVLLYRARIKTADLHGRAYLEMWCRLPGQGEFFSKGFPSAVRGTTDWASCETPFRFENGQTPDLIKLNLVIEGRGTVWIQDIRLQHVPASGGSPAASHPSPPPATTGEVRRLEGHTGPVRRVAFSADGRRLLSGSGYPYGDGTMRLWDVASGKELRRFQGDEMTWVLGVALAPDGRTALSGSADRFVRLWDAETGQMLRRFEHEAVNGVAFAPDGRRFLSGGKDATVRLWDVESGRELRRFEGHTAKIEDVAFAPDGRRALSGGEDGSLRLWDVETGRAAHVLMGHGATVGAVAFSPDGRRLLSGGFDRAARLWDADSGRELLAFEGNWGYPDPARMRKHTDSGRELLAPEGHAGPVRGVAFAPDGRRVLSGGEDRVARLWDTQTGRELRCLEGHADWVWAVAFAPDGRLAATAGGTKVTAAGWEAGTDFAIRLWDVSAADDAPEPAPPGPQGLRR